MKGIGVFFLTVLALAPAAIAQSLNIDVSSTSSSPASTYGGPAGQMGVWNILTAAVTPALVDLSGIPTAAAIAFNTPRSLTGNWPCPGDVDEPLVSDNFYWLADDWTATITGLVDDDYGVVLYAPSHPSVDTGSMTVNGAPVSGRIGSCVPVEGTDWVRVFTSVAGGTLTITGSGERFDGIAGIQLIQGETPVELQSFAIE